MLRIMPDFYNLRDFQRGWIVGNFEPSIERIEACEVSIMHHKAGEETTPHFHTSSREINVVISGKLLVDKKPLVSNDIFTYNANEISNVEFLSDTVLCIIRIPSAPNDKIIVEQS
jgi:mannose-6-phosphate isomerase-like protein (cupin superfamily)